MPKKNLSGSFSNEELTIIGNTPTKTKSRICPICGTYYEGEAKTCKECRSKRTRNLGQKVEEPSYSYSKWQYVLAILLTSGLLALIFWFLSSLTGETPI